jgi:hypothetical protein
MVFIREIKDALNLELRNSGKANPEAGDFMWKSGRQENSGTR